MGCRFLVGFVAVAGVLIGLPAAQGALDISPDSLTQSIADAFVYELGTNTKNPESLFLDDYDVPTTAALHTFDKQAVIAARGYDLKSSTSSQLETFAAGPLLLAASAEGSSFADLTPGEVGTYGATQSLYLTNLKFFSPGPVAVDWKYAASGMPGELGTSDGIDMRLSIRQYQDATYAGSANEITNQFFGEGSSQQSFLLDPGYYQIRTLGRVLFNQPNELNRDGDSKWSYEFTITAVPEPATAALAILGALALCGRPRWPSRCP